MGHVSTRNTEAVVFRGYRLDSLIARAAAATQRSAPTRKRWASALRHDGKPLSRPTTHRHFTGCPHSPASKVLLTLEQLARGDGTTPWPLIAEGIATVLQSDIRTAPTEQLRARLRELTDLEHARQADEDRTTVHAAASETPETLEAAANADVIEAELQLERAAIRRELAERMRRQR
jgi:hypothetical protein